MRLPPQISPLSWALCPPAAFALLVLSTGCTTTNDAALIHRPAMPTVVPPPKAVVTTLTEAEASEAALAAARAGEFPAARRIIDALADRPARARVTSAVVTALAADNPVNAASLALALSPDLNQAAALETAARARARRDAKEALTWVLTLNDPALATIARLAVAEELVRADPGAALPRLRALPASTARDDLLALAIAAWAQQDANAAVSWARAVDDETLRQRLTVSAVFAVAQHAPARAAELAATLPENWDRGRIFSAIAQTWIATDASAAMAWIGKLPPGALREAAMAGVDTGTGAAGRRRHNSGPRLGGGNRMGGTGVSAAALEPALPELASFSAWMAAQTTPMSRDQAILEFIKQRGALDVGSIGNWVTTLPGGPLRQRALETYFDETLRTSPSAAANWLRSVPPSDRSDAMVEEVARRWLQTDPNAATEWLRESNLPQYRKEQILRSR